jgi:hypothetical protein
VKLAIAFLLVSQLSYDGVVSVDRIERIQDAVQLLRAQGATDAALATRLAGVLDISEEHALAIIERSYGRHMRDARSLRTVEIHMWVRNADLATATSATAAAWCQPLNGQPEHPACVAAQAGWFAGYLCDAGGTVRARWASLFVRPSQGLRLRAARTAGLYDGEVMDRAGFIAAAAARGFTICSPGAT